MLVPPPAPRCSFPTRGHSRPSRAAWARAALHSCIARAVAPWGAPHRRGQRGQATTEYALVLLGAAAVALLLVAWATKTGAFASLLDAVMDSIKKKV